jgi:acetamidase/formamidase
MYFSTGPNNAPTLRVEPGETFEAQLQINSGPWVDGHPDAEALRKKLLGGNPTCGCIYVEGAEPGDMLSVEILQIQLDDFGFTQYRSVPAASPIWYGLEGFGRQSRVVRIENDSILWDEHITLPARPMVGFVGVAPARETLHNGRNGEWGGNFDVQEITTGATVQLKVQCPGALLHMGDMHAIQGDGEICGAGGIETGGLVRVRTKLTRPAPKALHWPRIQNATHIMTVGFARPAEDAFRIGLEAMVAWLEEEYGMPKPEALLYLGQVLEARCTALVNPTYSYVCKVRREFLPPKV